MTVTLRTSDMLTASAALGVALLLAACSTDADPADQADGAAGEDVEATQSAAGDGAASDDSDDSGVSGDSGDGDDSGGEEEAQASGGIEGLYSDALPDGVETAAAGTAYIEIEGERLEFTGVECSFTDRDDAEAVNFTVEGETSRGLAELWVSRSIGWGVGFDYEEELVQVSHLGGEFAQISMAQNSGEEDGSIDWHRGDGPDPLIAVVGTDVVATGTLDGHPGSDDPQAGAFVMAANCG